MVPHAGPDSERHREVIELGTSLGRVAELVGSRVEAEVALVLDWDSRWALEFPARPSLDVDYLDRARALHAALWRRGITVDVVPPSCDDLDRYGLVIVPTLFVTPDDAADRLDRYVRGGGTVLVTYLSGIVDPRGHVRLGGYPGAFRELVGIRVEEFSPLLADEHVTLDDGSRAAVWTEQLTLQGAEAVARYQDGPLPGVPAITRHEHGDGTAWYIATRQDRAGDDALLARILAERGIAPPLDPPQGVEVVRRRHDDGRRYLLALNHGDEAVAVTVQGQELLGERRIEGELTLAGGAVAVIREDV